MGEEAKKPVDCQAQVFAFCSLTVESHWRIRGHFRMNSGGSRRMVWRGGSKGMSQSLIPQTFLQGLPGARPWDRDSGYKERETGDVSARSSELGSWPAPHPTASEATAPLPSLPTSSPVTSCHQTLLPGFIRKALENVEWAVAPSPERSLSCHSLGPLERRGRQLLKQRLLPSPCAQQREVAWALWSALGWGTRGGGSPSLPLTALVPPRRNSLFLPPQPISSKHWTHCQTTCWAAQMH